MNFFLKAKAWQVFLLLFGAMFVMQLAMSIAVAASGDPKLIFRLMPLLMAVSMGMVLVWLWTLGTRLYEYAPESLRVKPTKLKFGLIYSFIYMLVFLTIFSGTAGAKEPQAMALITPFHLLAMFFMFYSNYFISKHLVMAEEKRPVTFNDFAGPFFLVWFFPIGIWFIQPRINKLYEEHRLNKAA